VGACAKVKYHPNFLVLLNFVKKTAYER